MSEPPRELLDRMYAGWNNGDVDGALELFHPELEFQLSGDWPGFPEAYHGREGLLEFWNEFTAIWEKIEIEVHRYEQAGDTTVALWRFNGVGRGGVPVERDGAHTLRLEDGMVVYMHSWGTWEDALASVGIES